MIWKGFRFGMLLQIAIGPVCLFIFQTAAKRGFAAAELGVLGVSLIDAFYILLAMLGIGALLKSEKAQRLFGMLGALVLMLFGTSSILGAFSLSILPSFHFQIQDANPFAAALLLTLSNPLSILFWAGVFTAKLSTDGLSKGQAYWFGAGAVLSTIFFLTLTSLFGSVAGNFLGNAAFKILNVAVGAALIFFGVRTLLKTNRKDTI